MIKKQHLWRLDLGAPYVLLTKIAGYRWYGIENGEPPENIISGNCGDMFHDSQPTQNIQSGYKSINK